MDFINRIVTLLTKKRSEKDSGIPSTFFSSEGAARLIDSLNATSSPSKGVSPAETLAYKISKISQSEYIIIARITAQNRFKIAAIADNTNILTTKPDEFMSDLLPVLLSEGSAFSNQPEDILLQINRKKQKAKSVSAILLRDNENKPIGAAFGFTKEKHQQKPLINALNFFSFNINSELQHIINQEKLEKKNRELLKKEEELKLKNQLLDNLNKNISKAKQIVDESSRLKSAFLANLSHEIRTPMNVIMGFTELLSADNMPNDQRRNYIDIIQQNGTRLLHIMDSLIDISRFQAKNIGKEQQAFSLNQMMQQLLNNFQSEVDINGKPLIINLTLPTKDGKDIVTLDKEATYKILNHLIDNAVKFTASGFVNFGYEIRDKQILFFVEDSGIGIPEGKEKEIFDLFRQGDLRLSRQFGGTGLGLAIAKRYVNAMNGHIWCSNNEKPERGASFKFTLPLNPREKTLSAPKPEQNGREMFKQTLFTPSNISE
ncbi:sensor histidine kinase [Marinilabilia rubra]|uniref:histidine kinase n=1 Tax=Marinilabilia rubra TaxID=2162893 RepID=A0A2U2B805_9BACT|nr:ATP-binding protein [Marinilabilia rubra]PWD99182.1 sensor histidine kinase [Marinilabilia rubra]